MLYWVFSFLCLWMHLLGVSGDGGCPLWTKQQLRPLIRELQSIVGTTRLLAVDIQKSTSTLGNATEIVEFMGSLGNTSYLPHIYILLLYCRHCCKKIVQYKFFEGKHTGCTSCYIYIYRLLFLALGSNDCVCEEGSGSSGFGEHHMLVIVLVNVLTSRNSFGSPELF